MARIGVCVLGAGDMGRTHARSWSQVEGAELIAVADPDEARARKSCEDHGFDRWFTDWREALEQPGIQAVSICVPSGYHCECSTAAMGHGYHVVVRSPCCLRGRCPKLWYRPLSAREFCLASPSANVSAMQSTK